MTHTNEQYHRPSILARKPRSAAGAAALDGLVALSDSVHDADERALQAMQLRSVDALALQHLVQAERDERVLNATQLAGLLRITTAAITKLVDRLVLAGRVERRPNPRDRRAVVITPTPGAAADLALAYGHIHTPLLEVIDGLTDDEATVVGQFASRLSAAIRAHQA